MFMYRWDHRNEEVVTVWSWISCSTLEMMEIDRSFSQVCGASLLPWIEAGAQPSVQGDVQDISGRPQVSESSANFTCRDLLCELPSATEIWRPYVVTIQIQQRDSLLYDRTWCAWQNISLVFNLTCLQYLPGGYGGQPAQRSVRWKSSRQETLLWTVSSIISTGDVVSRDS